jgi:peptide/nickel transport system substrate-binding protein
MQQGLFSESFLLLFRRCIVAPNQSKARHRYLGVAGPLFFVFALLLTACGGTSQVTSTATQAPAAKHVLTVVATPGKDAVSNFNPFLDPQISMWGTQGLIYETPLFVNQKDGKVTPWLASSYEVSTDGLTITLHLNTVVKWSDGTPLTSDDFLYTYQLMKDNAGLDFHSIWKTSVKAIAAPDAGTFVITLQKSDSTALFYDIGQTFIVQKKAWSTFPDPVKATNDQPVGTGPFTLGSFSSAIYKLAKNPTFWNTAQAPKVDEVDVPSEKSNADTTLLLSQGNIDWVGVGYDPKYDAIWVNKDPDHNHTYFPPSNIVTLAMNLSKFPFNNLAVRQAISVAIDRSELQTKSNPYAPPANPTGLILPAQASYVADSYKSLTYTTDDAKAETILKAAGFAKDASGIYALGGKEISFKLESPTGWTDWNNDEKLIVAQLAKVGIKVDAQFPDFSTVYLPELAKNSFDAVLHWTDPGPTPYYLYKDLLSSAQIPATNVEGWKDTATDKLLSDYTSATDPAAQVAAIQGLEKIMVEQVPTISLTYNPFWDEYSTTRFTGWPDKNNPFVNPAPHTYPDIEQVVLALTPVA